MSIFYSWRSYKMLRITISPPTNFLTKTPTIVKHDQHEFIFEGFSLLSHAPIAELPTCKVIRFNIEYTILYIEEKMPENFTIRELDLFCKFILSQCSMLLSITLILKFDLQINICSWNYLSYWISPFNRPIQIPTKFAPVSISFHDSFETYPTMAKKFWL